MDSFRYIKFHLPLVLPCLELVEVGLENFVVSFGINFAIYNIVVCKKMYRRFDVSVCHLCRTEREHADPRTEPRGTPDVTSVMSNRTPLTETLFAVG